MTRTSRIIIGGLLVRAFLGLALFWISYLGLPVARSLQSGDGFWFFAADGPEYLRLANVVAEQGLLYNGPMPSHLFVRLVAMLVMLFGSVASLAILINCAAYLGMCWLLVRMEQSDWLLAAIAFSPAAILFSTQLLKDTLFFMLIVLMVAIFRRWEELWRRGGTRGSYVACAAAMVAIVYALAGIRWYVAAVVWGASLCFFMLLSWRASRRALAFAVSALMFFLLAQSVRLGGHDIAPQVERLLNPATVLRADPEEASTTLVGRARHGFDKTPAATTIATGRSVAAESAEETPALPQTFGTRLITGFAATFLPRFLGEPLGLIQVGGGRGFWIFAEVDTLVFGCVVVFVAISSVRALRKGEARVTPLFLLASVIFVVLGGLMIYTVNNFGTLFRLRQMLYVVATVIPVTSKRRKEGEEWGTSLPANS